MNLWCNWTVGKPNLRTRLRIMFARTLWLECKAEFQQRTVCTFYPPELTIKMVSSHSLSTNSIHFAVLWRWLGILGYNETNKKSGKLKKIVKICGIHKFYQALLALLTLNYKMLLWTIPPPTIWLMCCIVRWAGDRCGAEPTSSIALFFGDIANTSPNIDHLWFPSYKDI